MSALEKYVSGLPDEIEKLQTEIEHWKNREQAAFRAGFTAGKFSHDEEQAWQQFRCKDSTDWRGKQP